MLTLKLGLCQFNRPITVLAQSKKDSIKQHDNSTTLVFLRDKTTPTPYKIRGTWLIEFSTIRSSKYIYYSKFYLFQPPYCLLHLSMRFINVLGGLASPRTTLGVLLPNGSSREAFPGFCGVGRALDRPNRSLDRFSRFQEFFVACIELFATPGVLALAGK
jgi:hypothetical protein